MEAKTWVIQSRVSGFAPDGYKQHALVETKRRAGNKIYDLLESMRNPAVIEVREEVMPVTSDCPDEMIQISIQITPVEYHRVEMPSGLSFDPLVFIPRPTFFRRLRYAILGK